MKKNKLYAILICTVVLIFVVLSFWISGLLTEKPLMTIACFSDPHHEHFVQDADSFVRDSSKTAVKKIKEITNGGADIVLVGGDITGHHGEWNYRKISSVMSASFNLFSNAAKGGKVLLVTGNHDPEPTVYSEITSINSNDYSKFMSAAVGNFDDTLYSADIAAQTGPFNELLCYKYTVKEAIILGINTPYGDRRDVGKTEYNGLYVQQVDWVREQLDKTAKDKTVFILCHYPPDNINEATAFNQALDKSQENASRQKMKKLLSDFPNIIYLCGHIHTEETETLYDSSEHIYHINGEDSAIVAHMGSLAYYDDSYNRKLGVGDAAVVQSTMIYIYKDKITFQVVNTGEKPAYNGVYELKPFIVNRKYQK